MSQSGHSLVEILLVLVLLGIISSSTGAAMSGILAKQRVSAATNQVLGLLYFARAESIGKGNILLCDASTNCQQFGTTSHLAVIRPAARPGEEAVTLADLHLPKGVTLRWVRFRGNALHFHADGRTHYQNGHFLICNGKAARRIVMNWASRPRVEMAPADTPCPA